MSNHEKTQKLQTIKKQPWDLQIKRNIKKKRTIWTSSNITLKKNKNWTLHHLSDDWDLRSATRTLCGSNARAAAHEHSCQVQRGGLVSLAFLWRVRGEA
jgi:hypothetical protein